MRPEVYLFHPIDSGFELYFGGFSTLDGLRCFDAALPTETVRFGATCYQSHGWATPEVLPELTTVGAWIAFLEADDEIGLVDFEIRIGGQGTLGSHDDAECHFRLADRRQGLAIVGAVAPPAMRDLLISRLISRPGVYWVCGDDGECRGYATFDAYLAR